VAAFDVAVVGGIVRWCLFAAILVVVGVATFDGIVLARLRRAGANHEEVAASLMARAGRLGAWTALALLPVAGMRLVLQVLSLEDPETPWLEQARLVVLETTWGKGWLVLLVGALLGVAAFARGPRRGTTLPFAVLPVALLSLAPSLAGHAIGDPDLPVAAVLADSLHMLAGGAWLGTLVVLALVGLVPQPGEWDESRAWRVAAMVHAFSPVALASAATLAVTGTFATLLHLDAPSSLWTSAYGRILLIKLALLAGVMSAGAFNWRRVTPRLGAREGAAMLRRSAWIELGFAAALLAATALLVTTPLPGE
jgi:putative copper export protein